MTDTLENIDTEFMTIVLNDETVPCSIQAWILTIHQPVEPKCPNDANYVWTLTCGHERACCKRHLVEWMGKSFPCRECSAPHVSIVDFRPI